MKWGCIIAIGKARAKATTMAKAMQSLNSK